MQKKLSNLINHNDFKRVGFSIAFKNNASNTVYKDFNEISLVELSEGGLKLKVPFKSLQPGHFLTLYFYEFPIPKERKQEIIKETFRNATTFIGKVLDLTEECDEDDPEDAFDDEKYLVCNIELTQYDVHVWQNVFKTFNEHQKKVNSLTLLGKKNV